MQQNKTKPKTIRLKIIRIQKECVQKKCQH